jgi:hypothetical protein
LKGFLECDNGTLLCYRNRQGIRSDDGFRAISDEKAVGKWGIFFLFPYFLEAGFYEKSGALRRDFE